MLEAWLVPACHRATCDNELPDVGKAKAFSRGECQRLRACSPQVQMAATATHATAMPMHLQSGASVGRHGCQKANPKKPTARTANTRIRNKRTVSGVNCFFSIQRPFGHASWTAVRA